MATTEAQLKALAIVPKITASISIISSITILSEVILDHRHGRGNATLRALFGMCVIDTFASTGWLLSTWMAPVGSYAAYAVGTIQTCTFQGFLLQVAIGAPLYNATMALHYLLTINYGWHEQDLQRIEKYLHAVILLFTFGTGIAMIPLDMCNHIGAVCWVIGLPKGCGHSNYNPSDIPCERGNYAWIFGFLLFYLPLWICVLFVLTCMILIYRKFRATERRNLRWETQLANTQRVSRTMSKSDRIATQAILCTAAFFITWLPSTIWSFTWWFDKALRWLDMLAAICEPSQGSLNLLVFLRPRPEVRAKLQHRLACGLGGRAESSPRRRTESTSLRRSTIEEELHPTERAACDGPQVENQGGLDGGEQARRSVTFQSLEKS